MYLCKCLCTDSHHVPEETIVDVTLQSSSTVPRQSKSGRSKYRLCYCICRLISNGFAYVLMYLFINLIISLLLYYIIH